jgi:hypothetical protein
MTTCNEVGNFIVSVSLFPLKLAEIGLLFMLSKSHGRTQSVSSTNRHSGNEV